MILLLERSENRIAILLLISAVIFSGIALRYYKIAVRPVYTETSSENRFITISVGESQGTIYDRNMKRIVNSQYNYIGVIVPKMFRAEDVINLAQNKAEFMVNFLKGRPFSFRCTKDTEESVGLTVFKIPERYSENQSARHIIGYLSENKGMDGLEYAYDSILRNGKIQNSVSYSTDGFGNVLIGDGKNVVRSMKDYTGVVTSINLEIQQICENAGKSIEKGTIIVSETETGDILALASFPQYSPENIEDALKNPDLPLINRALYSYSVGSVFKLVTACHALQNGSEHFFYNCNGNINIFGQSFNCHKPEGHGLQNMTKAIVNSCNTYFIAMSRNFKPENFRETARSLGFGREIYLCSGITASAGVLPTVSDLEIPAELANFSFGQGKLSASPMQINQLTCTIANSGKLPVMRLIKGLTTDGKTVANEKNPNLSRAISEDTAMKLREMMISAVEESTNSNAKSETVKTGAKTSTAQTGQYDENGNEICHAWITGFFPAENPKYAVTVLVEGGGYGNDASAPVFREIAEKIMQIQ